MDKFVLRQAAMRHPSKLMQPYDTIISQDGFDALYTLIEHVGGRTIYVPSMRTILSQCLEAEARSANQLSSISISNKRAWLWFRLA